MILLVCGGREYTDRELVYKTLDDLHQHVHITLLVHGGAKGADKLADMWACDRGVQPVRVPALWSYYEGAAGPVRNRNMLKLNPNMVVAYKGGSGTADMVRQSRNAGLRVWEPDIHPNLHTQFNTSTTLEKFLQ